MLLAIEHGHHILSWQENLVEDEIPPTWMWSLDEELNDWFEQLESSRKDKGGGGGDEPVPMMQNELAKSRR